MRHPVFALIDLIIFIRSCFFNPYKEVKRARESSSNPDSGNVYGETPLILLKRLFETFGLTSEDVFCDLGSGLGRVSFWVYYFVKCKKVIGMERMERFVLFTSKVQRLFFASRLSFIRSDFTIDYPKEATFIYFYGTSYSSEIIRATAEKLKFLNKGAVVITASYPITDFLEEGFRCTKILYGRLPWGRTVFFKNVKESDYECPLLIQ
ncbi:MAG: hypothetical protein RSB82_03505 [Victivallaceae bacterium]